MQYDMIRESLMCAEKLMDSQLNLLRGTKKEQQNKEKN